MPPSSAAERRGRAEPRSSSAPPRPARGSGQEPRSAAPAHAAGVRDSSLRGWAAAGSPGWPGQSSGSSRPAPPPPAGPPPPPSRRLRGPAAAAPTGGRHGPGLAGKGTGPLPSPHTAGGAERTGAAPRFPAASTSSPTAGRSVPPPGPASRGWRALGSGGEGGPRRPLQSRAQSSPARQVPGGILLPEERHSLFQPAPVPYSTGGRGTNEERLCVMVSAKLHLLSPDKLGAMVVEEN